MFKLKKIGVVFLSLMMLFSIAACGSGESAVTEEESPEPTSIELTETNVGDYIAFEGEYTDSSYYKSWYYYISNSTVDFKAYSVVPGSFSNVEVTLRLVVDSEKEGMLNEKWHLIDTEDDVIEFTFRMPAGGEYSSSYEIECNRCAWALKGDCEFEIVSVSGTFTPSE